MLIVACQVTPTAPYTAFATHDDSQRGVVLAHPDYRGLRVYSYDGDVEVGAVVPVGAVWINAPESLMAYANRRRKEIIEGKGGAQGRLIQVPIASGTYPVPIDATTRAALGDAAFQTTLPADEPYVIPDWLLPTGEFIVLDSPGIMTFALAVRDAFQAVFTAQNQAFAGIRAGTVTTTAQVDAILGG